MAKLTTEQYNELLGITDSYEAPARLMAILRNKSERETLFKAFLEAFDYDVSYDWFTDYFQDEHADRTHKKQDFTPLSITTLVAKLVGGGPTHYEPCSGTGGMTIAAWQNDRMKHSPFDYRPSWYLYTCEELSDRALPFLLFNLLIRGMNAIVVHGDVLTRKAYGAFFVQNDADDHLTFSSLNVLPYSALVEAELSVKFSDERPMLEPLIESPEDVMSREHVRFGEVSGFTKLIYAMAGVKTEASE